MAVRRGCVFVAVDGEAIVAMSGALIRDGYPAAITHLREGYIFGVRVTPEYRSRGIAEHLTREAIGYLERANCRSIRLHASRFGGSIRVFICGDRRDASAALAALASGEYDLAPCAANHAAILSRWSP